MADAVPVRCPGCLRETLFTSPIYPCACGAPLIPPLLPDGRPERIVSRTWAEDWVLVRCAECGRRDHWPQPEFGCLCGTVLRVPVRPAEDGPADGEPPLPGQTTAQDADRDADRDSGRAAPPGPAPAPDRAAHGPRTDAPAARTPAGDTPRPAPETPAAPPGTPTPPWDAPPWDTSPWDTSPTPADDSPPPASPPCPVLPAHPPSHISLPRTANAPRPRFRPVAIRSARDAVAVAELYLRWLGYRDVVRQQPRPDRPDGLPPQTPPGGRLSAPVDLRGPGLLAQVDPSMRPATLRDVECLWLNGLASSASTVFFSLAGYADDARARADDLGVPLFVMDLTGSPHPVNGPAAELVSTGP